MMPARSPIPLWFLAALAPMVASEAVRVVVHAPPVWLALDYSGRIAALAVLAAIPRARAIAFSRQPFQIGGWEMASWVAVLVLFDRLVDHPVGNYLDALFPDTAIAGYPVTQGWLHIVDISFGIALVACSEEMIFRRCARSVLSRTLGEGWTMVIAASMLFAGYHWWTGLGNIAAAMLFGIVAMLMYRRVGSLSPVILGHYICDVVNFY